MIVDEVRRPVFRTADGHDGLLFALCVAGVLGMFGVATHGGLPRLDSTYPSRDRSDSRIYLSMAAGRWIDAAPADATAWSIADVPLPFRYRILVPGLARLFPFDPALSLALVNDLSLVGAYAFLLLTCLRLGIDRGSAAIGLGVAFTFVSHVSVYSLPWLTDGFILLVLSAMTYAFVTNKFWLFAAWGLAGVFAREVPAVLLPVWCLRQFRRGAAITVIAAVSVVLERAVLAAPAGILSIVQPSWVFGALKQTIAAGPSGASFWPPAFSWKLLRDIAYCWGWGFAIAPVGLLLLTPDASQRFVPIAVVLTAAAFVMSLVATDTSREFMVMLPVVAVSAAQVTGALRRESRVALVVLLVCLAVLQFCLAEQNIVLQTETWLAVTAMVPMIKIGAVWTLAAAYFLRAPLMHRLRSLIRAAEA